MKIFKDFSILNNINNGIFLFLMGVHFTRTGINESKRKILILLSLISLFISSILMGANIKILLDVRKHK